MKRVRKAVIPAAGLGTRFLPVTKVIPKELLPVLNRPIIHYAIEELIDSGIEQIIIVIAKGKHLLEDYLSHSFELEHVLRERSMHEALAAISPLCNSDNVCYVHQTEQLGLGHAVLTARNLVGEEPFVVLLPDDIAVSQVPLTKQLIEIFQKYNANILAIEEIPRNKVSDYGIIQPYQIDERLYRVVNLIEKPAPERAPSRLGIVGRYVLQPEIFNVLEETPPGKGGEIQLTDALRLLLQEQPILGYRFEGVRYDVGTPLGLLRASLCFALQDTRTLDELRTYLLPSLQQAPSDAVQH
jgi:UTP--glucose-1-phosphate uridylyltransferase